MATLRQPICLVACEKGQMVCTMEKLKRSLIMMYLRTVTTAQMIKSLPHIQLPTGYCVQGKLMLSSGTINWYDNLVL